MRIYAHLLAAIAAVGIGFGSRPAQASAAPASRWISETAIDRSAPACTNFYTHACGGFLAATQLGGRPSLSLVQQTFDANLAAGIERLFAVQDSQNVELGRLRQFYQSCQLAAAGKDAESDALQRRLLAEVDAVRSPADFQALVRRLHAIGVNVFFSLSAWPDRTRWDHYRGDIAGGVLRGEAPLIRKAFVAAGVDPIVAQREAQEVAKLQARLKPLALSRWDAKAENPRSLRDLQALAPHVDWAAYLQAAGQDAGKAVNVTSPTFLAAVDNEIATTPIETLRAYARWSLLFTLRGELSPKAAGAFADEAASIRVATDDPAAVCRDATVRAMGVEFSRQYATKILGSSARDVARDIAAEVKAELLRAVADNRWLSPAARKATLKKLAATDLKIGYPDRWPAVGDYPIGSTSFLANVIAARRFEQQQEWARVGQARDRAAWEMKVYPWVGEGMVAARLVVPNGFPDALSNSLIMTAAFLAPPRFQPDAPVDANYGTFGAIFAHEFIHVAESHSFGADGRDTELWGAKDQAAAKKADACVIDQASASHPIPGAKTPGDKQYDENVADLGGVRIAFAALERRLGPALYKAGRDGRSPAQTFFYRYAQGFCEARSDSEIRRSLADDSHGQPDHRVNGVVANIPGFARAFGCGRGAPMAHTDGRICRVW